MRYCYQLLFVVALLISWELTYRLLLAESVFFPSALLCLQEAFRLVLDPAFQSDILVSFYRIVSSSVLALLIGFGAGFLLGVYPFLYRSVEGVLDFLRSIPATAFFPLFLLFFGAGDESKIFLATFSASLILIFHVAASLVHEGQERRKALQFMGASKWQLIWHLHIWESFSGLLLGARQALSIATVIIIVSEMFIGSNAGVGKRLVDFQISYETEAMYAAIFVCGCIGYVLNLSLAFLESRLSYRSDKRS